MQWADVSRALIVQHIVIASGALAVCAGICALMRRRAQSPSIALAVCVIALIALCASLATAAGGGPTRWINLGGFRLYVAALVLPTAIFLIAHSMESSNANAPMRWPPLILVSVSLVIALQPDAPQLTAFAAASGFLLWRAHMPRLLKGMIFLFVAACVGYAWLQPDPLKPVSYVEGVLELAQSAGVLAFIGALVAVACVPVSLAWRGVGTHSKALIAVAIYYVVIDVMATLQLTPMPLLGFGASPILGYFGMVALATMYDDTKAKL